MNRPKPHTFILELTDLSGTIDTRIIGQKLQDGLETYFRFLGEHTTLKNIKVRPYSRKMEHAK